MGVYRRSPRCSSCYEQGHTIRSCPVLKEKAAAAAAKPSSERGYYEQRALDKVNGYSRNSRSCSYCDESGHNAAGCKQRKQDIEVATSKLISWRNRFIESAMTAGMGIGAMVSHSGYSPSVGYGSKDNPHFCIIVGFNEEYINYWNLKSQGYLDGAVKAKNIRDFAARYPESIAIPNSVTKPMNENYYGSSYNTSEIQSTSSEVVFSSDFTSYAGCKNVVSGVFDQKYRNKKVAPRSSLTYMFE